MSNVNYQFGSVKNTRQDSKVLDALAQLTTMPTSFRVLKGRIVIPALPTPTTNFIASGSLIPLLDQNSNQIVLNSQDQIIYNAIRSYDSIDFTGIDINGGASLIIARASVAGALTFPTYESIATTDCITAGSTVGGGAGVTQLTGLVTNPEYVYVGLQTAGVIPYRDSDLNQNPVFVDVTIIVI